MVPVVLLTAGSAVHVRADEDSASGLAANTNSGVSFADLIQSTSSIAEDPSPRNSGLETAAGNTLGRDFDSHPKPPREKKDKSLTNGFVPGVEQLQPVALPISAPAIPSPTDLASAPSMVMSTVEGPGNSRSSNQLPAYMTAPASCVIETSDSDNSLPASESLPADASQSDASPAVTASPENQIIQNSEPTNQAHQETEETLDSGEAVAGVRSFAASSPPSRRSQIANDDSHKNPLDKAPEVKTSSKEVGAPAQEQGGGDVERIHAIQAGPTLAAAVRSQQSPSEATLAQQPSLQTSGENLSGGDKPEAPAAVHDGTPGPKPHTPDPGASIEESDAAASIKSAYLKPIRTDGDRVQSAAPSKVLRDELSSGPTCDSGLAASSARTTINGHSTSNVFQRPEVTDPTATPASASSPPDDSPTPAPPLSTRAMERITQSGIHVGLRSTEFGSIEVHTNLNQDRVGATIATTHAELRSAMQAEIPALQDAMARHQLRLENVAVSPQTGGQGGQSGDQHPESSYRPRAAAVRVPFVESSIAPSVSITLWPTSSSSRLSVIA